MPDYNININVATNARDAVSGINELNTSINTLTSTFQKKIDATQRTSKSIADYDGNLKTLNADLAKNRQLLDTEIERLTAVKNALGKTSEEYKKQDVIVRNLEKTIRTQTSALSLYNKELGITTAKTKQANSGLNVLTSTFNKLGAVIGVSFGMYGVFRALQYGIKVIADFDLAQAKLRSILGETKKGMEEVSESAIRVGQNSIFGAKGVTELQIELAKMGFSKDDIVSMQEAIVNLATATQEELAPAAEIVANIIRAYGLTASDAARVTDIMGKAFNDSALDLANFREAIKYVAPIAAQANFKFEETVALLEQLSNVGLKGSLAGTGLTNIISRLGDANSKFSKTLGHTVSGFDEFIAGMIELKNRGLDLGDTFELVDRRAAAAFTVILQGTNSIEEFKKKLEDSNGVMKNQTAVQLDTVTNKWKLMTEAMNATILSIDKGDGVFSRIIKGWVDKVTALLNVITNVNNEISGKKSADTFKRLAELDIKIPRNISNEVSKQLGIAGAAEKMAADAAPALASKYLADAKVARDKVDAILTQLNLAADEKINGLTSIYVENFRKTIRGLSAKDYYNELATNINNLSVSLGVMEKQGQKNTSNYKIMTGVFNSLNKELENYQKTKELIEPASGDGNKAAQEKIQREIQLLEIRKKVAAENIKLTEDNYSQEIELLQSGLMFDKKILDEKLKLEIESGVNSVDAKEKYDLEVIFLETKFTNDLAKIWEERAKVGQKVLDEVVKKGQEAGFKKIEEWSKARRKLTEEQLDQDAGRGKNKGKNKSILDLLGVPEEEQDAAKQGFDIIKDQVSSLADAYVESMDRIVEARNNMVSEAQQALETEIQLAEAGFANNVSLKRKELEEAKRLRSQALDDQKKAQRIQLALDTAQQASSLAVATAQLIAASSKFGLAGLLLVGAGIATIFSTFAKFKALAKEQAAVQYEKGGWIGGKRHSQGGTMIEAETGEFVINRKSASKYKPMIEAINKDDNFSLNRIYLNNLKNVVLRTSVSLDESKDLKAIRKVLESQGKSIEYTADGYRIERNGNVTTRIRLN